MITKKLLLNCFFFFALISFAKAQTNTWTGAVNNNWNTSGNWSLGIVPTAAHDAVIPTGFTVNLNVGATINSLQVQGTSVFNWSNQLSIAGASSFGSNSTINWNSNNLTGGGTLTNQGTLTLIGAGTKSIIGFTTLNNEGTLILQSGGDLYINDGVVNNQTSGIIDVQGLFSDISYSGAGSHILNNAGLIQSSSIFVFYAELNNTGTLNVQSGEFRLQSLNKNFIGGTYHVAAGAKLQINGPTTCSGMLTGTLDGALEWNNILTVAPATTAIFNFSGSTGVQWTSSNLTGGGTLINQSVLNLTTAGTKSVIGNTTLNNEGTITLQNGGDFNINDGIVNNQSSGVIDIQANASEISYSGGSSQILNNAGLIRRSTTTGIANIYAVVNNTGTINVESGTLRLLGLAKNLTGGVYNVAAAAELEWAGPINCSGTLTGLLEGPIDWRGEVFIAPATTATFNFSGASQVLWSSSNLRGGGTLVNLSNLNLTSTASKSILDNTTINNTGTLQITDAGDLFITDGILNNLMGGTVSLEAAFGNITYSGGSLHDFNNMGTLRNATPTGYAIIDVVLNNTGTINVETSELRLQALNKNLTDGVYNVLPGANFFWNGPITCEGTLTGTLDGPITWGNQVTVAPGTSATFDFSGTVGVNWTASILTGGGNLTNLGVMNLTSSVTKSIIGDTTFNNEGIINIASNGDLFITQGVLNNQATGTIDFQDNFGDFSFSGGTSHIFNNAGVLIKTAGTNASNLYVETTNTGTIEVASGTLLFSGPNTLNNTASGIIKGIGTIDLPAPADFVNNGTFAPGASPGTLSVIGDFESTASSVLDVELNGYTPNTEYDVLAITGNAILEGNVNISMGFEGFINDTFTVATTTGTITTCNLLAPNTPVHNGIEYEFSTDCSTNPNQLVLTIIQKTDIAPPTVVTQDITVYLDPTGNVSITPAQIDNGTTDNVSTPANLAYMLDVTSFSCADIGDNTVTLTVTDEAGNSANASATVTVLGTDTTYTGGVWDNGAPNAGSNAIITGLYDTASEGSINTCTCEVDASGNLTIAANDYLFSANNITVNGNLFIAHQGSVVQEYDFAQVIKTGTIQVEVITPDLASRDFMVMGSPMTAETRNDVFASAFLVLNHNTLNFVPNPDVAIQFPMAENFADDNYDNWNPYSGSINPGEGYIVRPQAGYGQPGGIFTMTHQLGTLNNGMVHFSILYNTPGPTPADNRNASPNVLANPYASALDADAFLTANPLFNEVYFWEHLTPPSPSLPGAGSMNFSMEDISMYNLMGGTAAAADPSGIDTQPNGVIATGQGFGIKATGAGTAVFNNSMRLTSGNTTLRNPLNKDRIWLKVQSTAYPLQSNCLIGFSEITTEGIDAGYDSNRLATVLSIYSSIEGEQVELGIQSRELFEESIMIPIGFSSLLNEVTSYKISLSNIDSDLLSNTTIYLFDRYLNELTLLTDEAYGFESGPGNFPDRFQLLFEPESVLGTSSASFSEIKVFPNPTQKNIFLTGITGEAQLHLLDPLGRKVLESQTRDTGNVREITLPDLPSGLYTLLIETDTTKQVKKIMIR